MLTRTPRIAASATLLGLLVLAGCQDPIGPGDEPWQAVHLDEPFVQGYTGFGFDLFRALLESSPDENLFISPTSAAFVLAMTYNGAAGETQQTMARVLGVGGMTRDQVNENNRRWLESLVNPGGRVELSLANSLWIRQGFPTLPDFLERNRTFYKAEVRELDFGSPNAARAINDWVSQHTRGKIDRIVEQVPPNVVMYLINALYFKADWTQQFDRRNTREEVFTLAGGARKTVSMMNQSGEFPVFWTQQFQAVSLPYGNGRFSMVLVLPNPGSDLGSFYAQLDAQRWEQWMEGFTKHQVMIALPRFKLEWEKSLKPALVGMGMGVAFAAGQTPHDFTAMSPANPWLDEVKQKTYLEVNEEGTTAAAVTVASMPASAPPMLRFDRPFFLAIRDNATRTLLFMGQIAEPM
jgi:serine protease inhibitor